MDRLCQFYINNNPSGAVGFLFCSLVKLIISRAWSIKYLISKRDRKTGRERERERQ